MKKKIFLFASIASALIFFLFRPVVPVREQSHFEESRKGPRFVFGRNYDGLRAATEDWDLKRLKAPDGRIPENMRAKELAFARTLPVAGEDSGSWEHLGPPNVGGRTRAAAIDVNNERIILAAGVSGGVWRSTDGGMTWTKRTDPGQFHSVTSLVQDTRPGKTHIWYYGTGEGLGNSAGAGGAFYLGNGLYKSEDSGKSWMPLASTVTGAQNSFDQNFDIVYRVAVNPANDSQDVVYAACYGAILQSLDGGSSWETVLGSAGNRSYTSDILVTPSGVAYATLSSDGSSQYRGIWRSTDGRNWTRIQSDSFPKAYDRIVMAFNPANENQLYFLARTPGYGKKTAVFFGESEWTSLWKYEYRSGDGSGNGGRWQDLSANIPNAGSRFDHFNSQGGYDLCIAVSPLDSNVVFLGGTNVYRSDNAFRDSLHTTLMGGYHPGSTRARWKLYEKHHPDQHLFLFLPSETKALITANDGGLYKTSDAYADTVRWESLNHRYITTQLYAVSMNEERATPAIAAGFQDNGNFVTRNTDPGSDWVMPLNGDGSYSYITSGEEFFYLSKQRGKVYKFRLDAAGDSVAFTRIDPADARDALFINPFTVDPNDEDILYFPAGRVLWRNRQLTSLPLNGRDDSIHTGWDFFPDTLESRMITSLSVSRSFPAHTLYFGTDEARIYRIDNAHADGSAPILLSTKDPNGFPAGMNLSSYTSSIAVDPGDANKLLIAYSNYRVYSIFYSRDGGQSWEKAAGNLEQFPNGGGNGPSIRSLAILPLGPDTIYFAGSSVGLFATSELQGENTVWVQYGSKSIGNVVVEMVKVREEDGQVLVATHGNGIYRAYFTPAITGIGSEANNTEFELYPNPARRELRLRGDPVKAGARYHIFDESGRHVRSGTLSPAAGVSLEAMAPGIYFLQLESKDGKGVRTFIKAE